MALLRVRLSLQEGILQLEDGQVGKVPVLLSAGSKQACTTLCAHTCVGRIRYVGVVLYDADRIPAAASVQRDHEVYPAHLDMFLDPTDPETIAAARSRAFPNMSSSRCPTLAGLSAGQSMEAGVAAAPGIPDIAHGLVHSAAQSD